jgi:hypothetical protein
MLRTRDVVAIGASLFAACILLMVGFFNIIYGLAALIKGGKSFLFTDTGVTVFSVTSWGWIMLIFGIVQVVAGVGIFRGYLWARILGIAGAILNAAGHLAAMGTYPWWSLSILALDVLVIYALATMPNPESWTSA